MHALLISMPSSLQLIAGEEIDATLGVKLGFSTMASAGLGNLVWLLHGCMLTMLALILSAEYSMLQMVCLWPIGIRCRWHWIC